MLRFSRATTLRHPPTRVFSTAPIIYKSAVDSVKETIKGVDRKVSDAAVKGIEKSEQATQSAKDAISSKTSEASGKVEGLKGEAKGKAEELKGEAKGKAEEVKGKM